MLSFPAINSHKAHKNTFGQHYRHIPKLRNRDSWTSVRCAEKCTVAKLGGITLNTRLSFH